jgi:hypothetical protein
MPGANYGLSKGFLMTGSTAVIAGQTVTLAAGSTLQPAQCAITTAITNRVLGVLIESLDVAKVTTGKATVGVQLEGIVFCIAGAAVALGAFVSSNAGSAGPPDTRGRAITTASTAIPFGIALSAAAAAGDMFPVLLTPGLPATP